MWLSKSRLARNEKPFKASMQDPADISKSINLSTKNGHFLLGPGPDYETRGPGFYSRRRIGIFKRETKKFAHVKYYSVNIK